MAIRLAATRTSSGLSAIVGKPKIVARKYARRYSTIVEQDALSATGQLASLSAIVALYRKACAVATEQWLAVVDAQSNTAIAVASQYCTTVDKHSYTVGAHKC